MIKKYLLFFLWLVGFLYIPKLYTQNFNFYLERNIGVKNNFKYNKTGFIDLNEKKFLENYRIVIEMHNNTEKEITAIIIRYSFSLIIEKNNQKYRTIPLLSSSIRASSIKKYSKKKLFIYDFSSALREAKKFSTIGYKPVELVMEIMKEPKKQEELEIFSYTFPFK